MIHLRGTSVLLVDLVVVDAAVLSWLLLLLLLLLLMMMLLHAHEVLLVLLERLLLPLVFGELGHRHGLGVRLLHAGLLHRRYLTLLRFLLHGQFRQNRGQRTTFPCGGRRGGYGKTTTTGRNALLDTITTGCLVRRRARSGISAVMTRPSSTRATDFEPEHTLQGA